MLLVIKMLGSQRRHLKAKYLFLVLLITCVIVVIVMLSVMEGPNPEINNEDTDTEVLNYVGFTLPQFSDEMLDEDFEQCFLQRFYSFSSSNEPYAENSLANEIEENATNGNIVKQKVKMHPVIATFLEFINIAKQVEVEIFLIEPSVIFCMLSPTLKSLLQKRGFPFTKKISEPVITIGMLKKYVAVLEKDNVQNQFKNLGFYVEIIKRPILSWMHNLDHYNDIRMENYSNRYEDSIFSSHLFFKKEKWIIQLTVFYERNNYLWHSRLSLPSDSNISSTEIHHFANVDSAFESFTVVTPSFKLPFLNNISIPSNPAQFLNQIETSRFLECNKTIVETFKQLQPTSLPMQHSSLSVSRFNQRLAIALAELKLKLDPLLLRFWIWSGTMLGWHRQCDVIPYTSDVDFAAWASDVDDVDQLIETFVENEHLKIKQKMGMADEALEFNLNTHGLRVDLFFIYQEANGTWYSGHCPKTGNYFKYHHPNFSLCSAELLEHKVLVPCETEKVISAEYGSDWMHPVSSWSYETSAKNIGPNVYWEKSLLKKVYIDY